MEKSTKRWASVKMESFLSKGANLQMVGDKEVRREEYVENKIKFKVEIPERSTLYL